MNILSNFCYIKFQLDTQCKLNVIITSPLWVIYFQTIYTEAKYNENSIFHSRMLHVLSLLEMHLYLFPLIQMSVLTTPPLPRSLSLPEYNFRLSPSVSRFLQTRLTFKLLCPLRYKLMKKWNNLNAIEPNIIFRGRHVTVTTLATTAFIVNKVGKVFM